MPSKQNLKALHHHQVQTTETEDHVDNYVGLTQTESERLYEMTKSDDATARARALSALVNDPNSDYSAIRSNLISALSDQDPEARSVALESLAGQGGSESIGYLAQALQDRDSSVRLTAVKNAPLNDEGISLFKNALIDSDDMIRNLARERLQEAIKNSF